MKQDKETRIKHDLLAWYDANQRVFVFRGPKDPYRVWLSEIMLQQTRTSSAGPYYERFLAQFPDVFALAQAGEEAVLKAWEGLGYYTRARNLHKTAQLVAGQMDGVFPKTAKDLLALPGVGPYAAAAIASIAYDEPVPAMDGNLNRVISRLYDLRENIETPAVKARLQALGQGLMPSTRAGDMNQAMMDLGATICVPGTPDCAACPLAGLCDAKKQGDPATLPVMKQKKPPKQVEVGVGILVSPQGVLLMQRKEALLKGLYVFLLKEGGSDPKQVEQMAQKLVPTAQMVGSLGSARHIFTHRVWNMNLYHLQTEQAPLVKGGVWANAEQLAALPLPTAMSRARELALSLL